MNKLAVLVALLLIAIPVFAIHDQQVYDDNFYGYGGQYARDRRAYDPYTRQRYFGNDYIKPYLNYGSKGPTDRMMTTGSKSAYSGVFNLDTNSFTNRGRDPSFISNFDPEMRGYNRLDRYVDLLPYNPTGEILVDTAVLPKGTMRIISLGDKYGAGLNKAFPNSQFITQAINLPPLNEGYVYQAWIVDDETEYPLSLGLMKAGAGLTSTLVFSFYRKVDMFDYAMITREPFPDIDPYPSEIVLMGRINPPRRDLMPPASDFERLR